MGPCDAGSGPARRHFLPMGVAVLPPAHVLPPCTRHAIAHWSRCAGYRLGTQTARREMSARITVAHHTPRRDPEWVQRREVCVRRWRLCFCYRARSALSPHDSPSVQDGGTVQAYCGSDTWTRLAQGCWRCVSTVGWEKRRDVVPDRRCVAAAMPIAESGAVGYCSPAPSMSSLSAGRKPAASASSTVSKY